MTRKPVNQKPIKSPGSQGRSKPTMKCEQCGRKFHPWGSIPDPKFCSVECSGLAQHLKAERRHPKIVLRTTPEQMIEIRDEMRAALERLREIVKEAKS